jgi:hypothetical protein
MTSEMGFRQENVLLATVVFQRLSSRPIGILLLKMSCRTHPRHSALNGCD